MMRVTFDFDDADAAAEFLDKFNRDSDGVTVSTEEPPQYLLDAGFSPAEALEMVQEADDIVSCAFERDPTIGALAVTTGMLIAGFMRQAFIDAKSTEDAVSSYNSAKAIVEETVSNELESDPDFRVALAGLGCEYIDQLTPVKTVGVVRRKPEAIDDGNGEVEAAVNEVQQHHIGESIESIKQAEAEHA